MNNDRKCKNPYSFKCSKCRDCCLKGRECPLDGKSSEFDKLTLSEINFLLGKARNFITIPFNEYIELVLRRIEIEKVTCVVEKYDMSIYSVKLEDHEIRVYDGEFVVDLYAWNDYYFDCDYKENLIKIVKRSDNYGVV